MVTNAARLPRPADVAVAAGCRVVLCGVLLMIPVLVPAEDPSVVVASAGTWGWWATLFTVTVQSVALVWVQSFPRVALVAVATVRYRCRRPGPRTPSA